MCIGCKVQEPPCFFGSPFVVIFFAGDPCTGQTSRGIVLFQSARFPVVVGGLLETSRPFPKM